MVIALALAIGDRCLEKIDVAIVFVEFLERMIAILF